MDFSQDDTQRRKAFYINLYNCLVIHSLIERRLEKVLFSGTLGRLKLYATSSYNIGGEIFSLNDIENGVLRGNKPAAAPGSKPPFEKDDPRCNAILMCDPRIHFALNCGAMGVLILSYIATDFILRSNHSWPIHYSVTKNLIRRLSCHRSL